MKAKYEKMIDEYVKKHYGDLERGVLAPEVKYKVLFKIYRKKYKEKKIQIKVLRNLLQGKKEIESWGSDSNSCSNCEHYVPMHPEGLNVIPASCSIGKSMTACCPFYSVKVDEKKAQKEMFDLHEVCGNCVHFREGKGKDKSTCAKHDKFVTETCSCYEFEDKAQKEMKTCDKCKYSTFKTVTNGREAATGKLWCTKNDFYASGVMTCDWFEDKESSYLDWLHDDITWCCRECSNMNCERNTMNRKMTTGFISMADMYDPFKCPVDAEMPEVKKK